MPAPSVSLDHRRASLRHCSRPTYTNAGLHNTPTGVKEVWETEHYLTPSGSQPAIGDGIAAAEEIHASMVTAGYNAYLWWWVADWDNGGSTNNYGLVTKDPADIPTYYGLCAGPILEVCDGRAMYASVPRRTRPRAWIVSAYSGSGQRCDRGDQFESSSASSVAFDHLGREYRLVYALPDLCQQ